MSGNTQSNIMGMNVPQKTYVIKHNFNDSINCVIQVKKKNKWVNGFMKTILTIKDSKTIKIDLLGKPRPIRVLITQG